MTTFLQMRARAIAYWLLVIGTGVFWTVLTLARCPLRQQDLAPLLVYVAAAILSSGLKIRLPGIFGTLSINYVVVIFALLGSTVSVGLIVALSSTLGQCIMHANSRPRWFQVAFSVGGIPLPVLASALVLHLPYLVRADRAHWIALLAASLVYMGVNTITVAGIIGLTTRKRIIDVWTDSYLWTYPQYLVGGAIAGGVGGCLDWAIVLQDGRFGIDVRPGACNTTYEAPAAATAGTTSSTSSLRKLLEPTLASARCTLR